MFIENPNCNLCSHADSLDRSDVSVGSSSGFVEGGLRRSSPRNVFDQIKPWPDFAEVELNLACVGDDTHGAIDDV